ncbi:hypothetical protein [Thermoflexibacter ruber]|uniref:Outer membrane protein beta-barrel domain-containing protein n=1 Tax=Thermoflexibacter ruber TaxID=1003 RepID=A0A1I2B8J9_9BACT|nr:hypothetical protein [Thermoflexibacter ruber]SFE52317.1 hypothetical protein SAMN04488541_1002171 [Thermoflexibacter ruber]
MIFRTLIIFFLFFIAQITFAQEKSLVDVYLQVSGSANAYKGDLSPSYQKWSSAFHIGAFSDQHRWFNPTASLSIGNLVGQNTNYDYLNPPRNNTFFKTNFVQFSLGLRLNAIKTDFLTVYLNPNIGIMRFTPKDIRNQKLANQPETRALGETLPTTAFVIPVNVGAMYKFKASKVAVGAEVGLLNPRSDYLDNIGEFGSASARDNSLQIKLSVYAPLTRYDAEKERKKQEQKKERRQEWLRKQGLLKESQQKNENKIQTTPKNVEKKKLTPTQLKNQKAKEKAEKEKQKKAEERAKTLEKNKKESEKQKQKVSTEKQKAQEKKLKEAEKRKKEVEKKKKKAEEEKRKKQAKKKKS